MTDSLFEPIKINSLELKNRICMPAMDLFMCVNYEVTDQLIDFYAERARGGAGLITVGFATADELSGGPLGIGTHHDAFIPGLRRLSAVIKEGGAAAAVQIGHSGRLSYSGEIGGKRTIAPSAIASRLSPEIPRELSIEEIRQVVSRFAQAAGRVKEAGFDCVEVMSATGYLMSQFLSPLSNKRTDIFGGSLENRMRFGLEVLATIRRTVGADFPIIFRISGNDFMPGGNGREELQAYARALADKGVDALNINVGWHEARVPQVTTGVPRGMYGYLARGIKDKVDVPVMASHRINDPETARELLADGWCDMVAMGRPLITDPYLPEKARSGREDMIMHCIGCAQACFDNVFQEKHVECLVNPKAGHEAKYCHIAKTGSPKKVMVVGGGAGGMSAALAASECGHTVTLYDASDRLGGQLYLAAAPPGRGEFDVFARDQINQVLNSPVEVVLNQSVDEALIDKEAPDFVIIATGAIPLMLPIPGVDLPNVVQAWDVLLNQAVTGKRVVIVGGGAVGVETALFLAEKGTLSADAIKFLLVNKAEDPEALYELATRGTKKITLIEMIPRVGKDIGMTTRWTMVQDMARDGVTIQVNTRALEITEFGVKVECEGAQGFIAADTVVLAAGSKPHNPLSELLEKKATPYRIIGDAGGIGTAYDAVHQGYAAGRNIRTN